MSRSKHTRNGKTRARKPKSVKLRCKICKTALKKGHCCNRRCPQGLADQRGLNVSF